MGANRFSFLKTFFGSAVTTWKLGKPGMYVVRVGTTSRYSRLQLQVGYSTIVPGTRCAPPVGYDTPTAGALFRATVR
eukprot:scaffold17973_cov64-Attheya_sp.AAC.1